MGNQNLKQKAKNLAYRIPIIGPSIIQVTRIIRRSVFPGSINYWESRYVNGGTSGLGSYGELAEYKAQILNSFVKEQHISSIIEFGCGDGHQLALTPYPAYIGLDVSKTAVKICKQSFQDDKTKSFFLYDPYCFADNHEVFTAELALSLEVIFHIVEDEIFHHYMMQLFASAQKFVIILSSDTDAHQYVSLPHVKHRHFSKWIETHLPDWQLLKKIPTPYLFDVKTGQGLFSDFFIYEKRNDVSTS